MAKQPETKPEAAAPPAASVSLAARAAFRLLLDGGEMVAFAAGEPIPAEHAEHWYVLAHSEPAAVAE